MGLLGTYLFIFLELQCYIWGRRGKIFRLSLRGNNSISTQGCICITNQTRPSVQSLVEKARQSQSYELKYLPICFHEGLQTLTILPRHTTLPALNNQK